MASKRPNLPPKKAAPVQATPKASTMPWWLLPGICLLLAFIAYLPVFNADFVNWDDGDYAYENKSFATHNLNDIMFKPVQGNYHPLTMLSLYANYLMSGPEDGTSYHVFNLFLHLLNTLLVFLFVRKLTEGKVWAAFVTALLFGIHPMHVESVAWVSERKDLLYSTFFLAGLISYVNFCRTQKSSYYIFTLGWLILSLMSKPAAVIFPVVLPLIDLYLFGKWSVKGLLNKLPFFALAAILGYLTLSAQSAQGATGGTEYFGLGTRILFGFYGFMVYFLKMLFPFNLSPFSPFPAVGPPLPVTYFIAPFFFLGLAGLAWWSWKRTRVVAFGLLFYFVNLLLVVQVIPVGSAIVADRYTYMPYLGLFFIIGCGIESLREKNKGQMPGWALGTIGIVGLLLTALTYQQAAVWKDGASLWDHAIKVEPSGRAYVNRAILLRKAKENDKALAYYNEALKINPKDHEAYCSRGNIYFDKNLNELALQDYNACLAIKPDYYTALDNRGGLYSRTKQYELALADFDKAISIKPDYEKVYVNQGVTLMDMQRYEESIKAFETNLRLAGDNPDILNSIAVCRQALNQQDQAIAVLTKAIQLKAHPIFLLNRAISYNVLGKKAEARADVQQAQGMGGTPPPWLVEALK